MCGSFPMWIRLIMAACNQGWQIVRVTYIHHILQRFNLRDLRPLKLFFDLPTIIYDFYVFWQVFSDAAIMVSSYPTD